MESKPSKMNENYFEEKRNLARSQAESKCLDHKNDKSIENGCGEAQVSLISTVARATVAKNEKAHQIVDGFKINFMSMQDTDSGRILWNSGSWSDDIFVEPKEAHIPASILQCRAVTREINFTSVESIDSFRLVQKILFQGTCIEEWSFTFGFVIPQSTNSWQQTIVAAGPNQMLPAAALSGNIVIETSFYDADFFIGKSVVRVFYI